MAEGLLGDVAGTVIDPVSMQQTMNIYYNSSNLETVTDLLENKRTVKLEDLGYNSGVQGQQINIQAQDFTDYLMSDRINPADNLAINSLVVNIIGDGSFMSNLIAMASGTLNIDGLKAEGLNLSL